MIANVLMFDTHSQDTSNTRYILADRCQGIVCPAYKWWNFQSVMSRSRKIPSTKSRCGKENVVLKCSRRMDLKTPAKWRVKTLRAEIVQCGEFEIDCTCQPSYIQVPTNQWKGSAHHKESQASMFPAVTHGKRQSRNASIVGEAFHTATNLSIGFGTRPPRGVLMAKTYRWHQSAYLLEPTIDHLYLFDDMRTFQSRFPSRAGFVLYPGRFWCRWESSRTQQFLFPKGRHSTI